MNCWVKALPGKADDGEHKEDRAGKGRQKESELVLVVDNDAEQAERVCAYLSGRGYRTCRAANAAQMWAQLDEEVDLVVLEHLLPGEDGLSLCRALREKNRLPVIMVGAHDSASERIIGLEIGADDYLCKPFDLRELLARIRAVRRRVALSEPPTSKSERHFAGWRLDLRLRRLYSPKGGAIDLTRSDFRVLEALSETPNRIVSRDELSRRALGRDYQVNDRSVDVCISRLRHYLEDNARRPRLIRTMRNEGYVLEWAMA
ncbi:response regulator [Halomonas sp. HMF6819]|uniref:response regulator n=1 Tax=Halomonas sp. HMF6819 TaxID=3373085 RepID=UPI00378DBC95